MRIRHTRSLLAFVAIATASAVLPAQQFSPLVRHQLPPTSDVRAQLLLDFDGDGDIDIYVARRGAGAAQDLLLRNVRGRFEDVTTLGLPQQLTSSSDAAAGDIDGDGDLDIVVRTTTSLEVLRNNGAGVFVAAGSPAAGFGLGPIELGDFDGDGDLDAILPASRQLFVNDGAGAFALSLAQIPNEGLNVTDVVAGDFDGDGDLDYVTSNSEENIFTPYYTVTIPGKTALFVNDGTGTFSSAWTAIPPHSDFFRAIVAGDLDQDGDLDLAVAGSDGSIWSQPAPVRILLNDGAGGFSVAPSVSLRGYDLGCADLDGDGDLDLMAATWGNIGVSYGAALLQNDGAGGFTDATSTRITPSTDATSIALGDLDGDGDVEAVLGSNIGVRVEWNLQRQLHAAAGPQLGQPWSLDTYMRFGPASQADLSAVWLSGAPASLPTPFGLLGLDPATMVGLPVVVVPQPAGVQSLVWSVPAAPALAGLPIYAQALQVSYPSVLRLSNAIGEVLQ